MSRFESESGFADVLDLALTNRGSASAVADRDVADLVEFARMLEEAGAHIRPSDEFRARSRKRLAMHMARSARQRRSLRPSVADRARVWTARLAAGLGALTLAGAAAAGASASALPGDALYPIKQVSEATALQLAPTDALRQDILVHQAGTRLDETARLLQQGRDDEAATTAAQYEQTLASLPNGSSSPSIEPEMATNQARLTELLQTAPGPARAGLERALSATERHTNATVQNEDVKPAAVATPTEIADAEPAKVRPSVPADATDRGRANSAADAAPASVDQRDLPNRADRTPVDGDVAGAKNSEAPPPPEIEQSHPAPHADTHPATSQPPRSAPERSGPPPRPAPPGHSRP